MWCHWDSTSAWAGCHACVQGGLRYGDAGGFAGRRTRKGLTDAGSAFAFCAGGFGGLVLPGDMPHNLLAAKGLPPGTEGAHGHEVPCGRLRPDHRPGPGAGLASGRRDGIAATGSLWCAVSHEPTRFLAFSLASLAHRACGPVFLVGAELQRLARLGRVDQVTPGTGHDVIAAEQRGDLVLCGGAAGEPQQGAVADLAPTTFTESRRKRHARTSRPRSNPCPGDPRRR